MSIIIKKVDAILSNKKISKYQLAKLINYHPSSLYNILDKKSPFPKHIIKKLLPILEVTRDEFDSWIIADIYSKEILELALKHKTEIKKKKKELILTIKVDSILKEKNMSRTALSKLINYSQSGLNRMITGKISLSDKVRCNIAPILEVAKEEILSWIVADKYSTEVIKLAINHLIF